MTGIVCAMSCELNNIALQMTQTSEEKISGIVFLKGKIGSEDVIAATCGIGKVNAAVCTQTMILKYSPELIINSGVAGGLAEGLKPNDIVVATEVAQHDFDPLDEPFGFITELNTVKIPCDKAASQRLEQLVKKKGIHCLRGLIASGDQFISGGDRAEFIKSEFNGAAAEMEGASVGHVCALNGVPFCVLRSVSDNADSSSPVDYNFFVDIAAKNAADIIVEFIKER